MNPVRSLSISSFPNRYYFVRVVHHNPVLLMQKKFFKFFLPKTSNGVHDTLSITEMLKFCK